MRFVCLFTFLCFLLLGAYRLAASGHEDNFTLAAPVSLNIKQLAATDSHVPLLATATPTQNTQYVFAAEDDDDISFSRKYVLVANYFVALAFACWLIYYFRSSHNRLHHFSLVPKISVRRYIAQHSLRI